MTNDMGTFVGAKIADLRGGKAVATCPQKDNVTDVPVAEACRSGTNLGGVFTARAALSAGTHLALSGRTMEFDGKGKCVAGR